MALTDQRVRIPNIFNSLLNTKEAKTIRDWGEYKWAFLTKNVAVKILSIPPSKAQKLHKHLCKNKTVVVTKGVLEIEYYNTSDNVVESKLIHENLSHTIPSMAIHALKNPGNLPLEIIEVQTGHDVQENDIQFYNLSDGQLSKEAKNSEKVEMDITLSDLTDPNCYIKVDSRPWGKWYSIINGKNYQVKVIEVHPKQRLSDQSHYYRSEHWVVVHGSAEVEKGKYYDDCFQMNIKELGFGQSTFIQLCRRHRLSNPSDTIPLLIVEVQVGDYLGEDDINRYSDDYNRE
jgi:mannose-6-phosphate isomerase